jgi:predicted NodU family carbamoyl transferase
MELTAHPYLNSIATAYMHAWRHEGKLTGLSARGKPTLTPESARHFWTGPDGVVKSDFKDWRSLEKGVRRVLNGHDRETIAASIQQLAEDVILSALRFWIERSGISPNRCRLTKFSFFRPWETTA